MDDCIAAGQEPLIEILFIQHEEDAASGNLVRGSEPWELVYSPVADSP
jgi:hypothetical protein